MITEDKLKEQLKPFSVKFKKVKNLLPDVLNNDEIIKGIYKETYNNEKGFWVFTTVRIFFIDSKKNIQKESSYEQLINLTVKPGYLATTLTISFSNDSPDISVSGDVSITLDFLKDKIADENNKKHFLNIYPDLSKQIKNKSRIGCLGMFVVAAVMIFALANSSDSPKHEIPGGNDTTQTTAQPVKNDKEDTSTQNAETASDKIKDICKDKLGSQLISVEVNDNIGKNDGSKIVLIHLKGQTGVSDEGSRKMMLRQSIDLLDALYTSGQPISEVTSFSEATMVDKYGKGTQTVVMKCTLKSDTAAKIEWKNKGSIDFTQVLDSYWVSPSLRNK